MLIRKFNDEEKAGSFRHEASLRQKQAYKELVLEGKTYNQIIEELKITKKTLTRYALETNLIPSLSKNKDDFDRNMMYHCIRESNKAQEIKKAQKEKANLIREKKKKYQYNPDIYL